MSYLDKFTVNGTDYDIRDTTGENIADAYSSSATYAVGDYCWYGGTLYKCIVTISTAEEWTAAHWSEVNVIDEVKAADAAKAALVAETVTGSIASFSDGSDGLPVKDLTIAIEPKQAGSGDPSPSNVRAISGWTGANVTRTGKNLFDPNSTSKEWVSNQNVITTVNGAKSVRVNLQSGQSITLSNKLASTSTNVLLIACLGESDTVLSRNVVVSGETSITKQAPAGTVCAIVSFLSWVSAEEAQLEFGSTATDYEPYNGTTYPIAFPAAAGTVYGGSLDVTTGVLTVDRAMIDIGSTAWTKSSTLSSVDGNVFTKNIALLDPPMAPRSRYAENTMLSDRFKTGDSNLWFINNLADYEMLSNATNIYISASDYDDANAFMASMSGVMLCYELATPVTYQCTPTEVTTLLGANNIWSDTGDSTVTYLADTKMYIDNAIAAL